MTDERKTLAKKVKAYRKEHAINQMEFAEECGISDVSLCRIERQNSNVSLDTMQLLAARMGESVADLLTETDQLTYCLIPTPICINDIEITTYGIGVLQGNIMLNFILDVSDDYNKMLSLVELCTEQKLDPIHLRSVVDDILIE